MKADISLVTPLVYDDVVKPGKSGCKRYFHNSINMKI